jgi:Tetratricopeptide repeat.
MNRAVELGLVAVVGLLLTGFLSGCQTTGQTAQSGALVRARAAVEQGDYEFALQRLDAAESYYQPAPETKAEILYLKGIAYEALQRPAQAKASFQQAAQQYPTTVFGNRAREKLTLMR